ncbi:CSEP0133 putative effector protein [Blumeria hordei DH14]|uniref:CSEP0133 putative effector protein n=1 Tax=Blumeria graminis f. sp. hordei (strain DH14) TaxID=546991 RepID=N1J8G4_BLUG1|nr:CSEP0133 putative effector protein [Blumeria hordei DH14]
MRSPHLVYLSVIFGFFIFEIAAVYKCPSQQYIDDFTINTAANNLYEKGLQFNFGRHPGQSECGGIIFSGSTANHDLTFTRAFRPPFTTVMSYKLQVSHPSKQITLIECGITEEGYTEKACQKQ